MREASDSCEGSSTPDGVDGARRRPRDEPGAHAHGFDDHSEIAVSTATAGADCDKAVIMAVWRAVLRGVPAVSRWMHTQRLMLRS